MQIPKNVMQIGQIDPNTKVYIEDYVNTFLERNRKAETYLVFGKKDERNGIPYYLIYGVEKKSDWDRGSYPYFKKYERLGTIEGAAGQRVFKPTRGTSLPLGGYFIFYEQNEDMQAYMITVKERDSIPGTEEKEEVMEAVKTRREMRQKEIRETGGTKTEDVKLWRFKRTEAQTEPKKEAAKKESTKPPVRQTARADRQKRERVRKEKVRESRDPKRSWSVPELCRAGSLLLLLLLVVLGLTSVNRYPDMKAVVRMFSDAASTLREKGRAAWGESTEKEELFVIEETGTVTDTAPEEQKEDTLLLSEDENGQITWTIGQAGDQETAAEEAVQTEETEPEKPTETENGELEEESAETEIPAQAIARPTIYIVKKGDNLRAISRKFYGSISMVDEICRINEIENPNHIQPGQNILLP